MPAWLVFFGEMLAIGLCWCPSVILYNYLTYLLMGAGVLLLYRGICTDEEKLKFRGRFIIRRLVRHRKHIPYHFRISAHAVFDANRKIRDPEAEQIAFGGYLSGSQCDGTDAECGAGCFYSGIVVWCMGQEKNFCQNGEGYGNLPVRVSATSPVPNRNGAARRTPRCTGADKAIFLLAKAPSARIEMLQKYKKHTAARHRPRPAGAILSPLNNRQTSRSA